MTSYSEKQVHIIEAAEKLFSEKGFNGTSVRDIAEHAGVNLAMISYYFGSKDKLMEALFTYRGEKITMQLEGMLYNKGMEPLQKFYQLIDYYVERFHHQQCFHRIMAREQIVHTKGTIGDHMLKMKKTNLELIRKLVQEGQKSGQFKKNVDIPLMMATLISTVNHVLTTQYYYRELENLQSLSEEEFQKHIKKKLSQHLKSIFKAILTHEI